MTIDYLRDGNEIYRQSFAIVRTEANLDRLPTDLANIAVRLIHACGMTDIIEDLAASADAVKVGVGAARDVIGDERRVTAGPE